MQYLANAKIIADPRLVDMFCKLLRTLMISRNDRGMTIPPNQQNVFDFSRGFPDKDLARSYFEFKLFNGVEQVLENKYLPVKYHA